MVDVEELQGTLEKEYGINLNDLKNANELKPLLENIYFWQQTIIEMYDTDKGYKIIARVFSNRNAPYYIVKRKVQEKNKFINLLKDLKLIESLVSFNERIVWYKKFWWEDAKVSETIYNNFIIVRKEGKKPMICSKKFNRYDILFKILETL